MLLIVYLVIAPLYVIVAWVARRSGGIASLAGACVVATAIFSYGMFRYVCGLPLTCDVGGPGAAFYYFSHFVPVYAIAGAFAFGAGSVMVHRQSGAREKLPTLKQVAIDSGIVFAGLVVGALVMES